MTTTQTTVSFTASAKFGFGGKQFIARITGRDPKFTFRREFVGRKIGKRGETSEATVDEPGLYQVRDIDRKGEPDDSFFIVGMLPTGLRANNCSLNEAMGFARRIADGELIEVIAIEYAIAELRRCIADAKTEEDQGKIINDGGCWAGSGPDGQSRAERIASREALLAQLLGTSDPHADLRAERDRLVARLAEIDAVIGKAAA